MIEIAQADSGVIKLGNICTEYISRGNTISQISSELPGLRYSSSKACSQFPHASGDNSQQRKAGIGCRGDEIAILVIVWYKQVKTLLEPISERGVIPFGANWLLWGGQFLSFLPRLVYAAAKEPDELTRSRVKSS
jgi:hypothetical protein